MTSRKHVLGQIRSNLGATKRPEFGDPNPSATAGSALKGSTGMASTSAAAKLLLPPDTSDAARADRITNGREATEQRPNPALEPKPPQSAAKSGNRRGVAVYLALSLTREQNRRAEAWAEAAGCSVGFLIRRIAQSVRDDIIQDWHAGIIERPPSPRKRQGHAPISVTLTLPAGLARDLQAKLDPFGLLGLGRAVGPAFRARVDVAFDTACTRAGF